VKAPETETELGKETVKEKVLETVPEEEPGQALLNLQEALDHKEDLVVDTWAA
jgi:hypothetical protein